MDTLIKHSSVVELSILGHVTLCKKQTTDLRWCYLSWASRNSFPTTKSKQQIWGLMVTLVKPVNAAKRFANVLAQPGVPVILDINHYKMICHKKMAWSKRESDKCNRSKTLKISICMTHKTFFVLKRKKYLIKKLYWGNSTRLWPSWSV